MGRTCKMFVGDWPGAQSLQTLTEKVMLIRNPIPSKGKGKMKEKRVLEWTELIIGWGKNGLN